MRIEELNELRLRDCESIINFFEEMKKKAEELKIRAISKYDENF